MSRKTEPKSKGLSSIQKKLQELEATAAQTKAKLNQARQFLDKAPELKEKAKIKQQRAIFDRFNRPVRVEGPADFQLEYVGSRQPARPKRLRHERRIPWFTLVLLAVFALVAYYAWADMWKR
jgi:hypothetical protein